MAQDPYEIIEEIQHCIHCGRDIHDFAPAQRSCEDCIIEGRDMTFSKSYEEISKIASGFDPDSNDKTIVETSFLLNAILGTGPDQMMNASRTIKFLEDCSGELNQMDRSTSAVIEKAIKNIYMILFGS